MQMCALLGREELANPVLKHIEIRQTNGHLPTNKTSVMLTYDHVIGELRADGAPGGFSVTLFDEIPYLFPNKLIHHVVLHGNQVEIVTGYSAEQLAHATDVWLVRFVHRCRYSDDIHVTLLQVINVAGQLQSLFQSFGYRSVVFFRAFD